MADNEILKDAELNEVVGGSGIETMGFLLRLQREGLYTPKTPLVAGYEEAAAKELLDFLHSVKDRHGMNPFAFAEIYSDGRPNSFGYGSIRVYGEPAPSPADDAIDIIKRCKNGLM